jgi:hypothetical protein
VHLLDPILPDGQPVVFVPIPIAGAVLLTPLAFVALPRPPLVILGGRPVERGVPIGLDVEVRARGKVVIRRPRESDFLPGKLETIGVDRYVSHWRGSFSALPLARMSVTSTHPGLLVGSMTIINPTS